ncbi:glycosyltransferase family A protein [Aeromonas bestiarum]|uniref:glycosyltransferase family A protein n=1 Tax=Aeromonas TaxID=642 RepID=UPI000BFB6F00|nr:glycosyltransferase family A protein [Aeromonas sp. CA23]ATM00395.1 hypothetical protein CK910_19485 [Aeromonas sp. CA23]
MIYYAIPLRAKQTSNNWDDVCKLLYKTLQSISLTGGDYKVVVACHDKPDFPLTEFDDRVSFVKVWHPVPTDKNGYMADKTSKKNVARRKILELAQADDLFMFIDADDILAKDFFNVISSAFSRNPDIHDIAFHTGFILDSNRGKVGYLDGKEKVFYKGCGTCFISRLSGEDVNNDDETATFLFSLKDHTKYPESSLTFGRSVMAMQTPVVCYIVNHGSNDTTERVGLNAMESFVDRLECKNEALLKRYEKNFEN